MNAATDYYAILGVLPAAEAFVIVAAYRALAQRCHPDHSDDSDAAAHARMTELNEAYAVLSDPDKRSAYDRQRRATLPSGASPFDDVEGPTPPGDDPLDRDWRIALKFYPDLAEIEKGLQQFSWKLAYAYRAYLLETRQFEPRQTLAALMETQFLQTYFGDDERNRGFARRLIVAGERKAAQAMNEAIRVLGSNAEPARVIGEIAREFDVRELAVNKARLVPLVAEAGVATVGTGVLVELLNELGGTYASVASASPSTRGAANGACRVGFDGGNFNFPSEAEFRTWCRKELLPIAQRLAR